jgi:hypothetical protein
MRDDDHARELQQYRRRILELFRTAKSDRNVNSTITSVYLDTWKRIVKFEQGGDHRDEHRVMNQQSILRQLWFERRVLC